MKETEATRHMMKNWQKQQPDLWFHKIADSRHGIATGDRAIDVVACLKGKFIGLEFKLVKRGLSLPIKSIRNNQLETLERINETGGEGLLIIIRDFGGTKKHAYALYPMEWKVAVQVAERAGKKSVKLSYFDGHRIEYRRVGRQLNWDMSGIEKFAAIK